jgi:predicted phosphodiesterase
MQKGKSIVLFLSDLHIGQHHDKFTPTIARERILSIPDSLPKEAPKRLVLAVGGDVIDGSGIYLRHNAMITTSAREQADLAVELFTLLLEKLKEKWKGVTIEIIWILGNHGRVSRRAKYDDNWDIDVGVRIKELYKKDARVSMKVQKRQPHAIFKVGATKFYMLHRTSRCDVHLSTNARKGIIYQRLLHHGCDIFLLGHFHRGTAHCDDSGPLRLVVNGALGGSDPFYAEENGYWNPPGQAVIYVDEKEKPTADSVQWLRW